VFVFFRIIILVSTMLFNTLHSVELAHSGLVYFVISVKNLLNYWLILLLLKKQCTVTVFL